MERDHTLRVLHVMSRDTMSWHFVSCHFKKSMVTCEMTALTSDDDSADASCHVTSTDNTSLLTYHVRSRLKSSIIIIFRTAMHADSSTWPLRRNSVFRVKRQIASDCCDHVGDDELAHNSQKDVDFARDIAAAQGKPTKKKTTFEKALPAMTCQRAQLLPIRRAQITSSGSRPRASRPAAT